MPETIPPPLAILPWIRRSLALLASLLGACGPPADLVIYIEHDQVHSEPLIRRFEAETGLRVRAEYDLEASRTIGKVNAIRAEAGHTRCDVFWNNEVLHTVALSEEGLLASYHSPNAANIPEQFKDPDGFWTGFAARARVFIVNTDLMDPGELSSLRDLLDPRWAGKCGMARPLTGTTLSHMSALFDLWGEREALEFLRQIKARNEAGELNLLSGNGHVMRQVREGAMAFGLTDTDDFNVARLEGKPVAMVYPDQAPGALLDGTLLIPNTVAILRGAPHRAAAERFVDWLLQESVEAELAASRAAQIPVRASVPRPEHVKGAPDIKFNVIDYQSSGRALPARQELLKEMFLD